VRVAVPGQDDADVLYLIAKKRQIQDVADAGVCLPAAARLPGSGDEINQMSGPPSTLAMGLAPLGRLIPRCAYLKPGSDRRDTRDEQADREHLLDPGRGHAGPGRT
jgi:hypothetical protein